MREIEDGKWLTDLAFLVDLTANLNKLNMLKAENNLICAVFQTITAFEMKLKLWQAQVMANNFMHFDTLAKCSPVSSEKCAALLSILKKKFENIFQDLKNIYIFFYIFVTPLLVDINALPANFCMEYIELQSKPYFTREKYLSLHSHILFMASLFGSMYICEQLLSSMRHRKSDTSSVIFGEHLESSLGVVTIATEPA